MIFQLFRRTPRTDIIARLYGMIVAQARAGAFYRDYGVPDSLDGRFEMIVLHLVLLLRRLDREGESMRRLGQALFDLFCRDMDANLREVGVGDFSVPRKMRAIGEAFYGRQMAYNAALEEGAANDALAAALARNIFGAGADQAPGARRLAAYVAETVESLDRQDAAALGGGEVAFPAPELLSQPA